MQRKDFEEAVLASELNTNARFIALRYASHQKYSKDGEEGVWPSQELIAHETGISSETVGKYVKALIEDGWFVVIGLVGTEGAPKRVKKVRLEVGQGTHHLLTTRRRGQPREVMVKPPILYPLEEPSSNGKENHPLTVRTPSSNGKGLTRIITTNKEQPEEQELKRVADAPGLPEDFSARESTPCESSSGLINRETDEVETAPAGTPGIPEPQARQALARYMKPGIPQKDLNREEEDAAVAQICNPRWKPTVKYSEARAVEALHEQVNKREIDW